eukprot:Hpha_TRINITY_DN198_c0_g1::TRINITY_DN198_c0_g1_i1::g.82293::m.82293
MIDDDRRSPPFNAFDAPCPAFSSPGTRHEGDYVPSSQSPSASGGRWHRRSPCGGWAGTEASLVTAADQDSPRAVRPEWRHEEFSSGSGARRTPYRTLSPSPKEDDDPHPPTTRSRDILLHNSHASAHSSAGRRDRGTFGTPGPQGDSPERNDIDAEDEAS